MAFVAVGLSIAVGFALLTIAAFDDCRVVATRPMIRCERPVRIPASLRFPRDARVTS